MLLMGKNTIVEVEVNIKISEPRPVYDYTDLFIQPIIIFSGLTKLLGK